MNEYDEWMNIIWMNEKIKFMNFMNVYELLWIITS